MAYGFILFLFLFLSHISFFFSFSYSPPPSPLSHTLSSSLSPFVHSLLSVLSLTLPIHCSLFHQVANSRISELLISSLFYLRVTDSLFLELPKSSLPSPIRCSQVSLNSLATISSWFGILGWCCGFEIWDGVDGFEICGCVDLFGCGFFFFFFFFNFLFYFILFFFKVALVDVGLCWWWLVGVVAIGGRCCGNGGCAVVVDGDDREEIIYYFNVW